MGSRTWLPIFSQHFYAVSAKQCLWNCKNRRVIQTITPHQRPVAMTDSQLSSRRQVDNTKPRGFFSKWIYRLVSLTAWHRSREEFLFPHFDASDTSITLTFRSQSGETATTYINTICMSKNHVGEYSDLAKLCQVAITMWSSRYVCALDSPSQESNDAKVYLRVGLSASR